MTKDKTCAQYLMTTTDSLDIRKEVRDDAVEQFQVIHQKLWNVHVTNCSQRYQLLSPCT